MQPVIIMVKVLNIKLKIIYFINIYRGRYRVTVIELSNSDIL